MVFSQCEPNINKYSLCTRLHIISAIDCNLALSHYFAIKISNILMKHCGANDQSTCTLMHFNVIDRYKVGGYVCKLIVGLISITLKEVMYAWTYTVGDCKMRLLGWFLKNLICKNATLSFVRCVCKNDLCSCFQMVEIFVLLLLCYEIVRSYLFFFLIWMAKICQKIDKSNTQILP